MWPVVLAGGTAFLNLYATQPLLPLLMRVFEATPFAVSLTVTAGTVAVACAAPGVGRLADLVGRRRVIVVSAFLLAATTGLAALSDDLSQLVAWRFLQGLATPGVFAITIAYIHEQWPRSHVGRATAAYVSGTVTGGFVGRATAGVVASQAGWPSAFVVLAAVNVVAAVALWIWLPPDRRAPAPVAPRGGGKGLRALLANGPLVATDAVGFCVLFTQVAMFTYVTFHLNGAPYFLSTAALGSLFVVYLVGAAMTPIAGRVVDRYGHRAGLAVGVGVSAAGALVTLAPSLAAIVAGLALVATGVFMAQASASSHVGAVTARDRGLAVGLYATSYYLGGSLGGALPATLWERGGWPACVALVLAVQALTVSLAWAFWKDRERTEPVPLPALE